MDMELWKARFADWLKTRRFTADTQKNYLAGLEPFFRFVEALSLKSWTEANRDVLEEYRSHLFYSKNRRTGQALTVGTHVARLMSVKTFFRFLVREGFLMANPTTLLELPLRRQPLPGVLSEVEVVKLLEVPDTRTLAGIRDRAILETLYGTALRNAEMCSLTLDQVDLAAHLVRLQRGKGGKGRVVPLGQEAQAWLELYLERVRPQWLRSPQLTAIFMDRWGHNKLSGSGLAAIVRNLARRSGLSKPVTPHMLRHSCATHMLRRGAQLCHIQQLLGHVDISSTEHYTRVEISDLRRVLSRCHPRERLQG